MYVAKALKTLRLSVSFLTLSFRGSGLNCKQLPPLFMYT